MNLLIVVLARKNEGDPRTQTRAHFTKEPAEFSSCVTKSQRESERERERDWKSLYVGKKQISPAH